ncbi:MULTISPECIES: chaplin [unclassified Streptomyces]|uniref:chaplin n=1 Tax=unclassified Streptomyces TaxID=2593676 RepID=UPI0016426DC5|nr:MULTISPECIES: chaplin [Streptomyces]WKE68567.1 chaplin [Streptomyces sp. WP-1]
MKRVTRNGVIALAAASGAIAVAGPVYADSTADSAAVGSPGLISGNGIQLPVHVPVNVCGDTVNVVGLLNPAMGNSCANTGGGATRGGSANGGGATAAGAEKGSPGAVSGNGIQLPIDLPVNISGDSVNVVGILNPVFGNHSENTSSTHGTRPVTPPRVTPPRHTAPPAHPQPHVPPARTAPEPPAAAHQPTGTLAHTGADGTLTAAFAGAASLVGGAALYRRFRPGATR